mmetsp:Transcript_96029/g.311535  ORF Transcript_96029/g.311535 Transcript_96029/m.311535 type:complete len:200 (-) Transcript_96029:264-863(-)
MGGSPRIRLKEGISLADGVQDGTACAAFCLQDVLIDGPHRPPRHAQGVPALPLLVDGSLEGTQQKHGHLRKIPTHHPNLLRQSLRSSEALCDVTHAQDVDVKLRSLVQIGDAQRHVLKSLLAVGLLPHRAEPVAVRPRDDVALDAAAQAPRDFQRGRGVVDAYGDVGQTLTRLIRGNAIVVRELQAVPLVLRPIAHHRL